MVILSPTVMVRQIILVVQAGYAQAAVHQSVAGIDLSANNQDKATSTGTFKPGLVPSSHHLLSLMASGLPLMIAIIIMLQQFTPHSWVLMLIR
ncbi:hypothetical protein [Nostoc sp.]|uniref:hypothetical protein n=1 Tax=Nostoc sp. TaxID=1180 RepID=UPI002FF77F1A